ncbi:hypothetical protein EV195_10885 [Tenacibaculum skagerrakense]|uniref:Uncharacterized protein n=1 Tax=Tenacibaculum skagerrakense TaxID=186571 RepID=A0A4R2NQL5_9FLAO|nr:hypothetical protein [Tenacibaculum skagerrakense]TCP23615.1 hypothetical protein EV195_10885 [Tenacibaculum skagerrakense]
MKTIQKTKELTDCILLVTMEIKDKFPELYQLLDETPFLSSVQDKGIEAISLEEYLNTIRYQLKDYKNNLQ